MSVKIKGMKKLLNQLDAKYGEDAIQRISDKALMKGANVFVKELEQQFEKFKATGLSIEEITLSKPSTRNGVRVIDVHWKGPDNRYRIIHLNEWGTVKNPNPKGKGAIARAERNAADEYAKAIKQSLKEDLR